MGFEHRKSIRVKLETKLFFWLGDRAEGQGRWGQALNVSSTGVAFHCPHFAPKGAGVVMELQLPNQKNALTARGSIVHCERAKAGDEEFQWRVNFNQLEEEVRQAIRLYVLELAEPGTGMGRAYLPGKAPVDLKYKEMPVSDREQWLKNRAYLSMKELTYLKNYQSMLQHALGAGLAEGLKILGSRPLRTGSDVWIEVDLPLGQLHFIAQTLWCKQDPGEKAESGLQLTAFHKDEAMKLEKEF